MCCLWHTHERTHEQKKVLTKYHFYIRARMRETLACDAVGRCAPTCATHVHTFETMPFDARAHRHELTNCACMMGMPCVALFFTYSLSLCSVWGCMCVNARNYLERKLRERTKRQTTHTHQREHASAKWTNLIKLDLTAWHGQTHARVHTCAHEFTSTGTKHRPQRVCVRNRERANIAGFFAQIKRPDLSWVGGTHTRSCFRVVFFCWFWFVSRRFYAVSRAVVVVRSGVLLVVYVFKFRGGCMWESLSTTSAATTTTTTMAAPLPRRIIRISCR